MLDSILGFEVDNALLKTFIKSDIPFLELDKNTLSKIKIGDNYMIFVSPQNIGSNSYVNTLFGIMSKEGDFKFINTNYSVQYNNDFYDFKKADIEKINSNFVSFIKKIGEYTLEELKNVETNIKNSPQTNKLLEIGEKLFTKEIKLKNPLEHYFFYKPLDDLFSGSNEKIIKNFSEQAFSSGINFKLSFSLFKIFLDNNWKEDILNSEVFLDLKYEYEGYLENKKALEIYKRNLIESKYDEALKKIYDAISINTDADFFSFKFKLLDNTTAEIVRKENINEELLLKSKCIQGKIPIEAIEKISVKNKILYSNDIEIDDKELAYKFIQAPASDYDYKIISHFSEDKDFLLNISNLKVYDREIECTVLDKYYSLYNSSLWTDKEFLSNLFNKNNEISHSVFNHIAYMNNENKDPEIPLILIKNRDKFQDFSSLWINAKFIQAMFDEKAFSTDLLCELVDCNLSNLAYIAMLTKVDEKMINTPDFIKKFTKLDIDDMEVYSRLIEKIYDKKILLSLDKAYLTYNFLDLQKQFFADEKLVNEIMSYGPINANLLYHSSNFVDYYKETKDNKLLNLIASNVNTEIEAENFIVHLSLNDDNILLQELSSFNPNFIYTMDEDNIKIFIEAMIDSVENIKFEKDKNTFLMTTDFGIFKANFKKDDFYLMNDLEQEIQFQYLDILYFSDNIINKINELYNKSIPLGIDTSELYEFLKNILEEHDIEK